MEKTVSVAVIGCGFAGNFHSNAWRKVFGVNVRLRAAVDNDLPRAQALAEKWGYEMATADYDQVLADPEVDIIDIALPPVLHLPFAYKAAAAGKHVICDKPLTGYFGLEGDEEPYGTKVPKKKMYETLLKDLEEAKRKLDTNGSIFMYAENYIYSPSMVKAGELLQAKKDTILFMRAECSIHGSPSPLSGDWKTAGGGSLMRLGSHSIAGVLYLKQAEARAKGVEIKPVSVVADVGQIIPRLSEHQKRHLVSDPHDVEDFSNITITFSDGTKAIVTACDNVMGGIKNYINVYADDGVIECLMTPANNMMTYYVDTDGLDDVYISEKLNCKTGWNSVFVAEETLRGYVGELQEFAMCAAENRRPAADLDLAIDTVKIIYAAYYSAEEGIRVDL